MKHLNSWVLLSWVNKLFITLVLECFFETHRPLKPIQGQHKRLFWQHCSLAATLQICSEFRILLVEEMCEICDSEAEKQIW